MPNHINGSIFERAFYNTGVGMALIDLDGRCVITNSSLCDLLGYTEGQLQRLPYSSIIDPEDADALAQCIERLLTGSTNSDQMEIRFLHKSGSVVWASLSISLVGDDQGNPRYFVTHITDITEHKRLEKQLKENEMRFRLLAENSLDMISRHSPENICLYISPSCKRILGYEQEELMGSSAETYLHPEDAAQIRSLASTDESDERVRVFRARKKDGSFVWLESNTRIVKDENHNFIESINVIRDITEQKRAEEELEKSEDNYRKLAKDLLYSEKLSVVGQLAAGIAHEIRNPLTAIRGFLQLMKPKITEKTHFFDIIFSEMDRIEQILNELLFLAKPHPIKFEVKDAGALVKQVVSLMESQAILRNIQLELKLGTDNLFINCDENQIKQAFINFLKNAIEAMPDGGLIRIVLDRGEDEQLYLRFIDQGYGIPEEKLEKLGEPFFTTKEEGTGLGLMVSKKILDQHGGSLIITSKPGEGTVVEVKLPSLPSRLHQP